MFGKFHRLGTGLVLGGQNTKHILLNVFNALTRAIWKCMLLQQIIAHFVVAYFDIQ